MHIDRETKSFSSMNIVVPGNASEGRVNMEQMNYICALERGREIDNCERGERRPVAVGRDGRRMSGERDRREKEKN
jgi:hypothetical protein